MKLNATECRKERNREALVHLQANGWTLDNFGHAKKEINGNLYRYKFQANTVRKEVRAASGQWVRLKTIPYKSLILK